MVGCGNVMTYYMTLAEELERRGLARVVAAADTSEAKRAFVRERYGLTRFSTDWADLIRAEDVDLVAVLTPMQTHGPIAAAALEAGKHVLVEKMMAPTLEEAARLVALARQSAGLLLCAPHVLLSPTYREMTRRLRMGDVGTILTARARYGWADPYWQGGWVYRQGAGALFEFACYNVTSLTGWLGPARSVLARTGVALPEREIGGERVRVEAEDNAQVLLDFGGGVLGLVTTGFTIQRYRSPAIELYGSTGTIQMLGDDWAPRGYELWQNDAGSWKLYEETDPAWPWTDGLRHLVECVQERARPVTTPEHAYHVLEILVKAKESGRDGQAKAIESRFPLPDPSRSC
jgi:predicted dehydrogenase